MTTYNNEHNNNSNRQQSDVEKLYVKMQGTFGGNVPWDNLDWNAQNAFVQSCNTIMQISSLRMN